MNIIVTTNRVHINLPLVFILSNVEIRTLVYHFKEFMKLVNLMDHMIPYGTKNVGMG